MHEATGKTVEKICKWTTLDMQRTANDDGKFPSTASDLPKVIRVEKRLWHKAQKVRLSLILMV